jgi:hypothetical protein
MGIIHQTHMFSLVKYSTINQPMGKCLNHFFNNHVSWPLFHYEILFSLVNVDYSKKKENQYKEEFVSSRRLKSNHIFMKGHLLHNIHNSDHENEKIFKTHAKTCFTINPWENKSL